MRHIIESKLQFTHLISKNFKYGEHCARGSCQHYFTHGELMYMGIKEFTDYINVDPDREGLFFYCQNCYENQKMFKEERDPDQMVILQFESKRSWNGW